MKVKVVYGSDIRRWHAPEENRYEALIDFIQNTFNFPDAGKFFLQYDDDEGDKITISSPDELGEAFASAEQDGRKSLKIFLTPVSIQEARQDALSQFKSSRSVSDDLFDVQSNSHAESACVDRDSDFESESPFDQEKCGPRTWQEEMTDFFANEAVNALLPDFVRAVLAILRTEQDAGLDIAILQTSSRDQFEAIARHSFFENHVQPNLETISLRATSLLPVLLAFDDDHIASIIPQLTETAIQMLSGVPDAELDVTPIFATLFPTWMAMMNANNPAGGSVDLMNIFGCGNAAEAAASMMSGLERKDDDVAHNDVTCDMCNVCPIRGARFKCAVCSNFDLCSACEATGTHNREHPLLKLSRPCRNGLPRARMHGLRELLGGRGRCGGGGWRKWHQGPENMHHPFAPPQPHHGHHGHPFPPPPPFGGPHQHPHAHPHPHPHGPPGHHGPFGHHGPWRQWGRFGPNFGQGPCGTQAPPPETDTSSVCSEATVRTEGGRKLKASFIEDVNIPDRSHYRPGLVLEKVWKMQNSGPSAWGDSCSLVFVKGCRAMTMEERFPVPNAQPGETVQVAAMIRTPDEANRYCAYYRLERDGSKFGPRVWVDIFVTEDESKLGESKVCKAQSKQMRRVEKLQKKKNKLAARQAKVQEKLNHVNEQIEVSQQSQEGPSLSCMCGSNLIKVHHKKAYRVNARINCDICGKLAKKNDQIYHCPNELSPLHPGGYDLCEGCGQDQFARKVETPAHEEEPVPPTAHVVEIEQSNPPEVIPSAPVEQSAEESGFPFQEALNTVMQMGFGDEEHVKYLLVEYEGNVENVVQHILSSA